MITIPETIFICMVEYILYIMFKEIKGSTDKKFFIILSIFIIIILHVRYYTN